VPVAVLTFTFDPVLWLSDTASVRYETIGLAVVLFLGLLLAVRIGSQTPAVGPYVPAPGLRTDDLVFIVVGVVPGAIAGGRLGYVLDHLAFYQATPAAILDPAQGGLSLTLAIPIGMLTGGFIARLLGAPVARWLHAAALPLLFVLGAGKLVGILGATGQGDLTDVPWATAYLGPGPWGTLAPELPAHPSQLYEALGVGVVVLLLWIASRWEVIGRRDGAAIFVALGGWAIVRFLVAFTWRDPALVGPLRTEQLLALAVLVIAAFGLVERARAPLQEPVEPRLDIEARMA
jgi:phosphatidylglycerol:prolipoprotein diacylglycerol transferase